MPAHPHLCPYPLGPFTAIREAEHSPVRPACGRTIRTSRLSAYTPSAANSGPQKNSMTSITSAGLRKLGSKGGGGADVTTTCRLSTAEVPESFPRLTMRRRDFLLGSGLLWRMLIQLIVSLHYNSWFVL